MSDHARTIRVTTFTAAEGQLDALIEAASANASDAAEADGCFGAQVLRPEGQDNAVAVISRWRDRTDLQRFLDTHEGIAHEAVGPHVAGAVTSTHYLALSD
jgi:heme-degrading monooxygenase HmoA